VGTGFDIEIYMHIENSYHAKTVLCF